MASNASPGEEDGPQEMFDSGSTSTLRNNNKSRLLQVQLMQQHIPNLQSINSDPCNPSQIQPWDEKTASSAIKKGKGEEDLSVHERLQKCVSIRSSVENNKQQNLKNNWTSCYVSEHDNDRLFDKSSSSHVDQARMFLLSADHRRHHSTLK